MEMCMSKYDHHEVVQMYYGLGGLDPAEGAGVNSMLPGRRKWFNFLTADTPTNVKAHASE
jgi:hypothetical protein